MGVCCNELRFKINSVVELIMFLFVFDDHREMELIKKFNLFLSQ